jgi:antitoxin MazE
MASLWDRTGGQVAALTRSAPSPIMYLRVDTSGDAMATKGLRMELMVSKWGNSLAVRLPAESAKRIGVGEGDTLIAEISADGRLVLAPEGRVIGKPETRRLRQFLRRQTETAPVVREMRRSARY